MVSNEFREWACSLSGCDGGNQSANTWLCGIEWGYAGSDLSSAVNYYKQTLPCEIAAGAHTPGERYVWEEQQQYPFGKSLAKLYGAYRGYKVDDYQRHLDSFGDSNLFKLNLYPIAFRHVGGELWRTYGLESVTGFKDKELYRIWCFFNRFPKFVELVSKRLTNDVLA